MDNAQISGISVKCEERKSTSNLVDKRPDFSTVFILLYFYSVIKTSSNIEKN